MPLAIRCSELQPGMRLAEALISQEGRVMLAGGRALSRADVVLLRQKYPNTALRIVDPVLDELIDFDDDTHDREVADTAQGKIVRAMSDVAERFSSQTALTAVNFGVVQDSVAEVVEYLNANPVSTALLARALDGKSYLSAHSGNVFYLSMILGSAVREYVAAERNRQARAGFPSQDTSLNITSLGLGAMFCDIGMLPLKHLFDENEVLTKRDRRSIREHPHAGAKMLPQNLSDTAKMIVKTHHENYDGTGYPAGIDGPTSHIFTRIVRIADAYDAATATHVYKEAKSPARALWEMLEGPYHRFYDPVLMKVFTRLIQPFPIGAKLHLMDGRQAVVVRYNRRNPFFPVVIVAFDAEGNRLPKSALKPPVSLKDRRDMRVKSFAGDDLAFLHNSKLIRESAPPRQEIHSLFDAAFP